MSAVRMCDRCTRVFSENADGWSSLQGSTVKTIDGRKQVVHQVMDLCPECAGGPLNSESQPYAALEPRRGVVDAETVANPPRE